MINLQVYLNTLRQKGYLAYEYNPFHNYQTAEDLYEVQTEVGLTLVPKGQAVNLKNGELLVKKIVNGQLKWVDKRGNSIIDIIEADKGTLFAKAGSLIDLDTDKLNFDLEHPVDIEVQPSYDGSVNLILNDDKNIPRLINSRFSPREKNTYEIVDRIGENDTNIYNSETFDKDTSLYFQYEYNPIIQYMGFVKGVLPVGQYCFYFTYCDSDDNESDYIAETGLIPVFIGSDGDYKSIDGGIKNQITNKGIRLKLSNIDKSYNYIKIYYVRYFADYQQNRVSECKKIYKRYPINSSNTYIQITGYEEAEDIDPNILNISRFNPKSILTQAQCKNMLFFGNIVKNADNYRELRDCALRIIPEIQINKFETVDTSYNCNDPSYAYYSSNNMYNNVGYFNQEYYRFGVVFIYQNGTLSSVYNTLGGELNSSKNLYIQGPLFTKQEDNITLLRNYIKIDDNGWIKHDNNVYDLEGINVNSKGVCHFNLDSLSENEILGIKFNIPQDVLDYLKSDLGIRGLFFVRQKCIPNILAQCYLMPMDEQLEAPVLQYNESEYATECFVTQYEKVRKSIYIFGRPVKEIEEKVGGRILDHNYEQRLYKYQHVEDSDNAISKKAYAAICPDFLLNQPYYNQIFNGSKFKLEQITQDTSLKKQNRFYRQPSSIQKPSTTTQVTICTVTEDVPTVALEDQVYRLEIGECEETFRFEYCEVNSGTYDAGDEDYKAIDEATNIVRGKYSPYLAIYSDTQLETGILYNIYQDSSINSTQEFQNRMDSSEPFYAIGDRYNFDDLAQTSIKTSIKSEDARSLVCWRGDCYINVFTYRLNRNFNDPSLPNNDVIIDKNTWKDNYTVKDSTKWENISRSDLNAVQLGSWITIKVRSAMNYALRSEDHSYVSEEALMGSPRSFYPRSTLMWRGENKMPDSYLYNDAYRASLGFKCYFALNDINYIKDTFSNRIQYSAISIQDSFKNNYRDSLSTYFRDYSQEYGGITKLIGFEGYLLVVFEHAIGVAVINERILAGQSDGEPVFINTQNVLPEELTIISDTYGTQWTESVVKTESGFVYGVDTVAKKIWRVKGQEIQIISDFKVNKFLIDNISLSERELYPTIGLRNVKTHYNNNKKDVMFTFYDDVYKDEEKVWNLCFNELLGDGQGMFTTFYSWIPSYSENIDTQFFTFNRDTAKGLALLSKCNYSIPENIGVLADSPIIKEDNPVSQLQYSTIDSITYTIKNQDQTTVVKTVPNESGQYLVNDIKFRIEKDHWGNWKYTNADKETGILPSNNQLKFSDLSIFKNQKVVLLYITPFLDSSTIDNLIVGTSSETTFKTECVAFTLDTILNNPALTTDDKKNPNLTTDFYLHGQAGIFNVAEDTYPTYWYGEQHPFEFEFVVNDKIAQQKIFENLILVSNKAEPESFHFEIEGDNFEFSSDKRTMYFRQEATKELYQNMGSDMLFNRKYTDIVADKNTQEQYYRAKNNNYQEQYPKMDRVYPTEEKGLVQQMKSTIFPLYYERVDTYNDIYHKYREMQSDGNYDFKNLSGSEVVWNRDLNQFNIVTHIKNNPMDRVGRLRGNSRYKEGTWNIQIPSISFMQKNEQDWPMADSNDKRIPEDASYKGRKIAVPPIVINSGYIPKDLDTDQITVDKLPNIYIKKEGDPPTDWSKYIQTSDWTYRKEALIRDKWMKVRVRYSGKNLAIIHSIMTLYNLSTS